ncbi:hypothetical protein KC571_02965 [candidate division WWE3 bacterium]|uniref:Carboxypeptidase regulatory-like domain-containing protein n=1 Tax=candidate division WWE3 bacterium TaxID=2053526 RepID=A0A955LH83_UNCKA|nr:hypothetical protein [candidate division WWE3 bacterium]
MFLDAVNNFVTWAQKIGSYESVEQFLTGELMIIDFMLLAIGFIVLLVEIRLPLKHYWELPSYTFRRLLQNLHILPSPPAWGTVKDDETNQRIPLAVVELVERKSLHVVATTFTNRLGEFGFKIKPGTYFVRAIKNYYQMPSFIDPENIELIAVDESFAMPIEVEQQGHPVVHLRLLRLSQDQANSAAYKLRHYAKTFFIAASNGALAISIVVSYMAWVIGRSSIYGLLIVIAVVLLFIKIYILETVGIVSKSE